MAKAAKQKRKAKRTDATAQEMRDAILQAMTRAALQGNTAAAKIVLDATRDTMNDKQPVTIIVDV